MWEGKTVAPINHDILYLPIEGGIDLLSIRDRNEAIKIKNLQDFLTKEGDKRAKWCSLVDGCLRKQVQQGVIVDEKVRISPFKQKWAPLQNKLPRALKQMLKTAKKFHLHFDALALAKDIKEELPAFFHIGGTKDSTRHNNSGCANCLRDLHEV